MNFKTLGICLSLATPGWAEDIQVAIFKADSVTGLPAMPEGHTRWVIQGPDDFVLAEEHGPVSELSFDLAPGHHSFTVWDVASGATASTQAEIIAGKDLEMALELSLENAGLVPPLLELLSSEQ